MLAIVVHENNTLNNERLSLVNTKLWTKNWRIVASYFIALQYIK